MSTSNDSSGDREIARIETIKIVPTWAGLLMALLALYEDGDRAYARAELTRMAMFADAAADAADVLHQIADQTDAQGNPAELSREQMRELARGVLAIFARVPKPATPSHQSESDG
ncbi:hypothetical protein [Burkholderia sp. TSV86]|uniref:hypothetical protein n=1 Tax=Burkholderia sp. TSV86 TaxID=1385594 RepID=UPI00075BF231|nr:hypothetical protein [Burkholderia sp. TSV86]KVE37272.1 hypothetical protein WS68_03390 [Burkholderia sp. TSV86]